MKNCPKCRTIKNKPEFYESKRTKDGLFTWCAECCRTHRKKYLDYNRKYMLRYRLERPEVNKLWKENNPEHTREHSRTNYQRHKPRFLRQSKARKLKITTVLGSHTESQWRDLLYIYEYHCFACGMEDIELTRDHLTPISRGGDDNIENIAPLCRSCNSKKGIKGPEWYMDFWYKQKLLDRQFENEPS